MVYNLLNVFLNLVFKNFMVNFCVSLHLRDRAVVFFFAAVFLSTCIKMALLSEFGSVLSFLFHRRVYEDFFAALVVLTMNPACPGPCWKAFYYCFYLAVMYLFKSLIAS